MTIQQKKVTENYKDNYDEVFGNKPIQRGSWVFDKELQKMVPKDEYYSQQGPDAPGILKPLEAFISPIDGTEISCRSKLRAHNKKHGVTNVADYGGDFLERKNNERQHEMNGTTKKAKRERIETIKEAMHRHGIHQ